MVGNAVFVAPLACAGERLGAVALVWASEGELAQAVLTDFADRLALRLHAERIQRRLDTTTQELTEQTAAADVADAFSVFVHELGNVLNSLVLDVRLLERHVAEEGRGRLAGMSRLASGVPQMLGHVYRFRQGRRLPPGPLDLNRVALRVVEALARTGARVQVELAPELPLIEGTAGALSRLVRLLLAQALAVTPASAEPVILRSACTGDLVRLTVEDRGPCLAAEALAQLFEPFVTLRAGQSGLELAICKSLVRRLQGTLEAVNRPEGGVAFVAELPIPTDHPSPLS
jgi:two-component system C4-dicarboxylate transport sensor histidine kinase DctB